MFNVEEAMRSVAGQISFLSTGERAALRRIYLTRSAMADGVVTKLLLRARVPEAERVGDFDRWRLMAHVAATLSGTAAVQSHAEGWRVGSALRDAGYSENRLLRLLSARHAALQDQIVRAARILARLAKPVNLCTLYDLAGGDADKAKAARIRIAQDYY